MNFEYGTIEFTKKPSLILCKSSPKWIKFGLTPRFETSEINVPDAAIIVFTPLQARILGDAIKRFNPSCPGFCITIKHSSVTVRIKLVIKAVLQLIDFF